LLESTPESVDVDTMLQSLLKVEGVRGVHDLHVWSINESLRALSAHIVTDDVTISQCACLKERLNEMLAHEYNIQHATLQLECANCKPAMLFCEIAETHRHTHNA
jgi:cobalt-zinc-cadmium efflux system protein